MKIPKHAKQVFKGVIFDVYQWPQKMFDGTTATYEKVIRQNTVVVIPTIGNKIVMIRQQQSGTGWYFDLPSGRMDKPGELPRQAALRELLEETGLRPKKLVLWKTYIPSGKVMQKVYYFIARNCKKVAEQNLDSGERIYVFYKTFDEFLDFTDNPQCFLGPITTDILLARIHKENKDYLKKVFFGAGKLPKPPKFGPKTNW